MKYSLKRILRDVRVVMDYNPDSRPLIEMGDAPTLAIDQIIQSRVLVAAKTVLEKAPLASIDTVKPLVGPVAWPTQAGIGMGYLVLPADFLRLAAIQMSDWLRPATIITEHSPEYAWQSSRFAGVRGNPQRPVAAIVRYSIGLVVELYASEAGPEVSLRRALYVPTPAFDIDLCVDLPKALYDDIISQCAILTQNIIDSQIPTNV